MTWHKGAARGEIAEEHLLLFTPRATGDRTPERRSQ